MEREIKHGEIHVRFIPPTKWWRRAKWELLNTYTSYNKNITVPAGFITDGASIPWFLRWRFSPTGRYFGAAIVHDFVLVEEQDWDKANEEFSDELDALGIPRITKVIMLFFVNLWPTIRHLFGKDKYEI